MIIFDGQEYEDGEDVWDLGSFVCTDSDGDIRHYEGLAADAPAKLPHYVETGSSALCLDTGDFWKFHKPSNTWYQLQGGDDMRADDVYAILNKKIKDGGGGGSGGTTNYNALTNKPSINGVTITGALTLQQLGIAEISNSEIEQIILDIGGL